jgi:hypothetical protein
MSARSSSRGARGRFNMVPGNEVDGREDFSRPKPRSASITRGTEKKVESWHDNETKEQEDTIGRIKKARLWALLCSKATLVCQYLTLAILTVILFFLLRRMIQGDNTIVFKTAGKCFEDTGSSCYSKFHQAFFDPRDMSRENWVYLTLTETAITDAPIIFVRAFPLPLTNPVVLVVAAIAAILAYILQGYIHRLMVTVVITAEMVLPHRRLLQEKH